MSQEDSRYGFLRPSFMMGLLYAIYKCIKLPTKVQVYIADILFTHNPSKLFIKNNNYEATENTKKKPIGEQSNISDSLY